MWDGREHGARSIRSPEYGESGDDPFIALHCDQIPAGCWLLGVAPLKSPSSCETCWVLGARLLDY